MNVASAPTDSRGPASHTVRRLLMLTAFLLGLHPCLAQLLPESRLIDWSPGVHVGVPGGVDQYVAARTRIIDVTAAPYNADKSGVTNAQPAIQSAISNATNGDVVYLPPGTYRIDSTIDIGTKSITLRGAGSATKIDCRATGRGISFGSGSDYNWQWPPAGNVVTGGLRRGSTQVTIADTSAFAVGQLVQFSVDNDTTLPVLAVNGYAMMRRQMIRVTGKTATTLTFFPPLYSDYGAGQLSAKVNVAQRQGSEIGIEDFVIDANGQTQYVIFGEQLYSSWIKNVHTKNARNVHIFLVNALNCEVRHCNLDVVANGGNPNGSGMMLNTSSGCLIEDNIIYKAFPLIEMNHGASGNVFAYNFTLDSRPGAGIDTNHGPHNSFNLYEGNIGPNIQADGYYGSVSDDTIFRNWITGQQVDGSAGVAIILNRMTRNYSIIGNLLGTTTADSPYSFGNPNPGNGYYDGTAQLSAGRDWKDNSIYGTLSSRTSDVSGTVTLSSGTGQIPSGRYPITISWAEGGRYNATALVVSGSTIQFGNGSSASSFGTPLPPQGQAVRIWAGALGYQEMDLDVDGSTLRKANWNSRDNGVPSAESVDTALPDSLYRQAKPSFFGNLAWPAFDPSRPNLKADAIPAGYRYTHGVDPASDGGGAPKADQLPISVKVAAGP